MIVDLHCHYPLHVVAENDPDQTLGRVLRLRRRGFVSKLRALVLRIAARLLNHPRSGTWRVDLDGLREGDVQVVLSVLYDPFSEMDLDAQYAARPRAGYFEDLVAQINDVTADLETRDGDQQQHKIVRTRADLDSVVASGGIAFLHCVEGGFHLGSTPTEVDANVTTLARDHGVAYITLAHLFWRQVATNAPALPFLTDWQYEHLFCQPNKTGLGELGVAAVRAMYRERVIVDLSHMSQSSIVDTLRLLDELDVEHRRKATDFPVIASHSGFRIAKMAYNVDAKTVGRIAARGGAVGLIFAQHQLNEGVTDATTTDAAASVEVLRHHIDAIHGVVGDHRTAAIGTDFDGFIRPTLGGFEGPADLAELRGLLLQAPYDPGDVDAILHGNALRVLRTVLP
jgi:microsomal dipeptidase-like Zn-dependent dipeptidase